MTDVSSVSAASSSGSSSSAAYDTFQAEIKAREAEHSGKTKESHGAKAVSDQEDPAEQYWNFDPEQAHKLYENLCNAVVNQCKQDQEETTKANQDLKASEAPNV